MWYRCRKEDPEWEASGILFFNSIITQPKPKVEPGEWKMLNQWQIDILLETCLMHRKSSVDREVPPFSLSLLSKGYACSWNTLLSQKSSFSAFRQILPAKQIRYRLRSIFITNLKKQRAYWCKRFLYSFFFSASLRKHLIIHLILFCNLCTVIPP